MLMMTKTTLANIPPQSSAILIAIDTEILLDANNVLCNTIYGKNFLFNDFIIIIVVN